MGKLLVIQSSRCTLSAAAGSAADESLAAGAEAGAACEGAAGSLSKELCSAESLLCASTCGLYKSKIATHQVSRRLQHDDWVSHVYLSSQIGHVLALTCLQTSGNDHTQQLANGLVCVVCTDKPDRSSEAACLCADATLRPMMCWNRCLLCTSKTCGLVAASMHTFDCCV